jgi:uncharacterized protein (TIGR00106 family)
MAYVSITPLGRDESVSEYVARAVRVIKKSGLSWRLTPMGTIIEADTLAEVFAAVNAAVEELSDCNRISISVKVDYRRSRKGDMDDKVESVMRRL